MANLNLSQFTEKTLVADADWVFVWDTAGAISKKVSRNSLLNSGTLTTSAPVTISQTWDAGTNVMTALKVVATDTASGTASNVLSLDLSTNNVLGEKWRFRFEKSGTLYSTGNIQLGIGLAASASLLMGNGFYAVGGGNGLFMGSGVGGYIFAHGATQLWRGSADHILEQRNGAAAQTFNVYGTSSSSNTVYERMFAKYNGSDFAFQIGTETAGATLRPLDFVTGGSRRMTIGTTGNVGIGTTNPVADLDLADTWNGPVINVTGASGTGSVATVTFAAQAAAIPVGTTVVIASMNPAGYDGTVVVTASSTTSVSYANATTAAYVVGGTVQRQFTAIKVNITDTASALTSKLLDLQVDGLSQAYVDKNGAIYGRGSSTGGLSKTWINLSGYYQVERFGTGIIFGGYPGQFMLPASSFMGWNSGETISASVDVKLFRDTNNTLALRNSTAAQTFRVYNTFPGTGNNEFGSFNWVDQANEFQIATGQAGTGTSRALCLRGQGGLNIRIGSAPGTLVWQVGMSTGHLLAGSDNLYDIGASGANRPRNVYVGSRITCADFLLGSSAYFTATANGRLLLQNSSATDFDRLQLGGTADTFPAIARDGAGIKFTGAAAGLTSHIKVPAVAVTSLPSAATAGVGARAFVNDALAPVFGSAVANGGSAKVPVYSDGSAWYVG